ncbi:PIR Superfamily Protein [Plasmodium ovale wallikeri]|uniref:PIR Superfamily Protein n=1 Tax=Plasmodium ovale wallikeri TaxID=864142 RepID=A0A1A9ATK7_PLAOA|nr:PIR Superfamily Protein [Plasmodium ovale wallikeri]
MEDPGINVDQIPEIMFFNNLFDDEDLDSTDLNSNISECSGCSWNGPINSYAKKIVRNYKRYENYVKDESQSKYCRYLIHWLFKKKYKFQTNNSRNSDHWDSCIPCLWEKLEKSHNNNEPKCEFSNEKYPNSIVSMRTYLEKLCSIRDYLGGENQIKLNKDKCMIYNEKKNEYINYILQSISSISSNITIKPSYFKINDNCSLKESKKTFPEIICPCDVVDTSTIFPDAEAIPVCRTSETGDVPHSEGPNAIITTDLSSPSYLGIFLSACLTFLITVLVGFLLYKFTPFGSWLHTRHKKRSILLKTMDDEITQDLLKGSLDNVEGIQENGGRYIKYEPF